MDDSMTRRSILIDGKVVPTFLKYSIPWILALLAMSSGGIIDGVFIGKYCGIRQLAALNLVFPVYSIFMGVSIVFCVGGVVRYAKYLGEKDIVSADAIFTKTILTMVFFSILSLVVGYLFVDNVMSFLGVKGEALQYARAYFMVLNIFAPCFMLGITISSFIRADGNVFIAGFAPFIGVVVNVLLDY